MTGPLELLIALVLLQAKHWVFDFLLQPGFIRKNKGSYGHPGGILHAVGHMLGSVPALIILAPSATVILVIAAIEGLVHYHLDWSKELVAKRFGIGHQDASFWYLLGFDQFLHQLTYLGIIWYFWV